MKTTLLLVKLDLNPGEEPVITLTPIGNGMSTITIDVIGYAMRPIIDQMSVSESTDDVLKRVVPEMMRGRYGDGRVSGWWRYEDDDDTMYRLEIIDYIS